ncbi:MAG: nucleotidyltransferase domain-containing protein [Coriobacteriales bacterium]|jgi:predicted nucleotidyltransferase|nr:nucleotidyltransferase domain-containing protein [Coriobacteriales bacterium]
MENERDLLTIIVDDHLTDLYVAMSDYGAMNLRVFGSVARRESDANSDVDFIVDINHPPRGRLFARAGLSERFSRILGRRVDIVLGDDDFVSKIDRGSVVEI